MANTKKLQGKVAVITGGTTGIGLAAAKLFVKEGAYVFITGRNQQDLEAAAKAIGKNVEAIQGDVSNLGDLDRVFEQIKKQKGKLDIVFANAGVARYARLGSITEELYNTTFDINVKGMLFTVQKALPLLPDGASIILNSSIVASKGLAANSVYSATKASLIGFTRSLAREVGQLGITVNALAPGFIATEMTHELGEAQREKIARRSALKRMADPIDIARGIEFLLGDGGRNITGITLTVDAGNTA